jgi:hypothetical protein
MNPYIRILSIAAVLCAFSPILRADGIVIYNTIPNPLPSNVPSEAFEATSTSEFGQLIQFAGSGSSYNLESVTVVMSDWTYESQWAADINGTTITSAGFYEPLTLNLYSVGPGDSVGVLIASETVDAFIPWRPEPSSGCASDDPAGVQGYMVNGTCYHGSLSEVTFNLTGVTVPSEVIYSLEYNTTDFGPDPTGKSGPYESLNFALPITGTFVGSTGPTYLSSKWNGAYNDNGAGGVGSFREDTASWEPYEGGAEFIAVTTTPEPSSLLLLASGLGVLAAFYRKTRQRAC